MSWYLFCVSSRVVFLCFVAGASCILVVTGPQDPMNHLTQFVWMAVSPPIFAANKNLSHLENP